jgi:chromatin modification-related protein EAF6
LTTVVVPAATKKQEQTAAQTKRDRDREYQRKKRANGSMRSTEPISDEEVVVTGRRGTKRTRLVDDD